MIPLSDAFHLGRDATRMKDPRDGARQQATAAALLERLFHDDPDHRWEIQILADEVGMGKTFVSLAVAYSLLESMQRGRIPPDLQGCYQKVVILTPPNSSLLAKWHREVSEFVRRCVAPELAADAGRWFASSGSRRSEEEGFGGRLDDFVRNLRKPGAGPKIVIAPMDVFGQRKLKHYDLKRRFLLAALFRYWGNAFRVDKRERLLRGAPVDWPTDPYRLSELKDWEVEEVPCNEDEAVDAIQRLDRPGEDGSTSRVEDLLLRCRDIAEPYRRDRDDLFKAVESGLGWLYREVVLSLFGRAVPLVIVDEVHNWKNGPACGTNGYNYFRDFLASRTRRALLLTATPFQLRPQEMLELIRIGEHLQPAPERSGAQDRRYRIAGRREVVSRVLASADRSSRGFAKAWSRLGATSDQVETIWKELVGAQTRIDALASRSGTLAERELRVIVQEATAHLDPAVRAFFTEALTLYGHNRDLSHEMGPLVVRHRRRTEHRAFRVGHEYGLAAALAEARPDRHVLHAAAGLDVAGEAELPHYLLMRCISDTKKGKGRSALGSSLTGCYSTLLDSADGNAVKKWIDQEPGRAEHFRLLLEMVNRRHDPRHPKVERVVEEVVKAWRRGEKTLLFCFRTNTAERLHEIIRARIERDLREQRKRCLGGEESFRALRGRMTRRDGDLMPLGLDRILWSLLVARRAQGTLQPADLELRDEDVREIARLCVMHGIDPDDEKADRVFLHRATENAIARRLARRRIVDLAGRLLARIADPTWVEWPYGLESRAEDEDGSGDDEVVDGRGVRRRYEVVRENPPEGEVAERAARLAGRRVRAARSADVSVLDTYGEGPNLWFGARPTQVVLSPPPVVQRIHEHLADLSVDEDGELDLECRQTVIEALRRALLRESVLVRILPTKADRHERSWGELLVDALHKPVGHQRESMAHHVEVFLEDLRGASGRFDEPGSARHTLLDATRLRDQRFVALVKGGDQKSRERVFAGFNSPLLPEVLVCTSVGAEGIDLHRHCRHVVHYDLAWNPAVLEQRTGRVDRIGSKTFRERALAQGEAGPFLEVGVPFLAGTYDERMYEELRLRAQVFEVLTGGEVAGDDVEGQDDVAGAEGKERGLRLVPLPGRMIEDLRVHLHVWVEPVVLNDAGTNPPQAGLPGDSWSRAEEQPLSHALAAGRN